MRKKQNKTKLLATDGIEYSQHFDFKTDTSANWQSEQKPYTYKATTI